LQHTSRTTQEIYLVCVAAKDAQRPKSEAMSRSEQKSHFLGREFGDQKEKQALIKSWLDLCSKEHDDTCRHKHGTEQAFRRLIRETYFGVIDVIDMQLKALPVKEDGEPQRYVSLSYIWGKTPHNEPPYQTTRSNVMRHILHGSLEAAAGKLSRTIQDAISLVSRVGERYLWIDSLCIVQDSPISWELNAEAMHLVYGNAFFTICAADGDASTGLRALHVGHRRSPFETTGPNQQENLGSNMREKDKLSRPITGQCAPGVRLMVTPATRSCS
jgi:heterokaryon incompatibility protein (HET)